MKKIRFLIFLLLAGLLAACQGNDAYQPYTYNANPKYTWGYAEFFGAEYADYQNLNNVLSVSVFSDSLSVDSLGVLKGTGQYLYLEDVFMEASDTLLREGTYVISKSRKPFTAYPGGNDTVDSRLFPLGARISYYETIPSKSLTKFITDGTFTVSRSGSVFTIICDFKTDDKKSLKGFFVGKLPHIDNSLNGKQKLSHERRIICIKR